MISPTFEPAQKPGAGFDAYAKGISEGQSWMDRAQEQTLRQQKIQQDIDNKPVEDAKRMADLTGYHAAIANGQILEETRRQAAEVAPQYLAEFLDITKIPDVDQKAAALDAFAGKTAWLGNMKENAGFVNAVKDAQGKAHLDSIAQGKIAQLKAATQQRADTGEAQIEQRAKAAELKAQTAVDIKARDDRIKQLEDETKRRGQDISSSTAIDVAKLRSTPTYEFEVTKALRDAAQSRGDAEGAALYDARLKKLNHIAVTSGEAMQALVNSTPAPSTVVVAPAPAPAPSASVDSKWHFDTLEDAQKAAEQGALQPGEKVVIGGKSGTWK